MSHEMNMSDKKRTTVTTIETHEVWIIRRAVLPEEAGVITLTPQEITEPAIQPLEEGHDHPNEEQEKTK